MKQKLKGKILGKKMKKLVKIWGIWDKKEGRITFVTLQRGSWYIAPSLKNRFVPKIITEIEI